MMTMNRSYVKQYDDKGILLNPIKGSYISEFPNRQQRHSKPSGNNRKNTRGRIHQEIKYYKHLTISSILLKKTKLVRHNAAIAFKPKMNDNLFNV